MNNTTLIARCLPALLLAGLWTAPATAGVDEIIAQFPAPNAEEADALFDALLVEGEEAITGLCGQLVPMGEGDDNAVRYALTGLARHASRPDAGDAQDTVEDALLAGLANAVDPEIQCFLLRQLQQCGTNASVNAIDEFLLDDAVASNAILALDALGTRKAKRALTQALNETTGTTQLQLLSVLSDDGRNRTAARVATQRLDSTADANEYVHLLSILVALKSNGANDHLIAAMDREEPRIRKAALSHAAPLTDRFAERKWRKKLADPG
ncbi:MAG: HEAT repeat domain-containing protein, partial [Legionella sp.]|nr:HEAT repeat domain-containing protein [Legionella sp.]